MMTDDIDDTADKVSKEDLKARKRQELKQQLEKSKKLSDEDREKLKSM
jgi:hypothetical protein